MKLAEFRTRSFSTRQYWEAGLTEALEAEKYTYHYVQDHDASNALETIDSDGLYAPPRVVMRCSFYDDSRGKCPASITTERQKDGQWMTVREQKDHCVHVLQKLDSSKFRADDSSTDDEAVTSIPPPSRRPQKYLKGGPVKCETEFDPPTYERFSSVSKQEDNSSDRSRLASRDPYDRDRRSRPARKRLYSPNERYRSRSPPPRRPYGKHDDHQPRRRRSRDDRYEGRREDRGRRRERSYSRGRSYSRSRSRSRSRRLQVKRERSYDDRMSDDRRHDRWPQDRAVSPVYAADIVIGQRPADAPDDARRPIPLPDGWTAFDSVYLPDAAVQPTSRAPHALPDQPAVPGAIADVVSANGFSSEIKTQETSYPTKAPWNAVPGGLPSQAAALQSANLPAVFRNKPARAHVPSSSGATSQSVANPSAVDPNAYTMPQLHATFNSKYEFEEACQAGVPPGSTWTLKSLTNTTNLCEKTCRHLDMHRACTGSNFRIKCERNARGVWRVTKAAYLHDNGTSATKASARSSYKVVSKPIPPPAFPMSDTESQVCSSVVTPPTDASATNTPAKVSILTHPPPAPIAGPSRIAASKSPGSSAKGKGKAIVQDSETDGPSSSLSEDDSDFDSDGEAQMGRNVLDLSTPASPKRSAARKTTGSGKKGPVAKKSTKGKKRITVEEEEERILRPSVPWLDNTAPPSRKTMLKDNTSTSRLMLPLGTASDRAANSSGSQFSPPTLPVKAKSRPTSPMNLDHSDDERHHSDPGRPVLAKGAYRMLKHHAPSVSGSTSNSASPPDWPMEADLPDTLRDKIMATLPTTQDASLRTMAKKTARKSTAKVTEKATVKKSGKNPVPPGTTAAETTDKSFIPKPPKSGTIVKRKPAADYNLPTTGDPIRDAMLRAAFEEASYSRSMPAAKNSSSATLSNSQPSLQASTRPSISTASARSIAKAEAVSVDASTGLASWLRSVHDEIPADVIAAVKQIGLTKEKILKMSAERWEKCCDDVLSKRISNDLELFMLKDTVAGCLRTMEAL